MSDMDLSYLGINEHGALHHNLSYEELYEHEMRPDLEGYGRCYETNLGAVSVDTGKFTGRSPEAKYFVDEPSSRDNIWWAGPDRKGSDNKPIPQSTWDHLKKISVEQLNGKELYVIDGFAGTNPKTRLAIRVICEVAWQAHFCKNMFMRPTDEELANFEPSWTILNASKTSCKDWQDHEGLGTEEYVAFHIAEKMTLIGGTWYGGEMKKGIFTMMNYFLPLRGVGSFHCSSNEGKDGDTALFFGLSGTGKTTLSTDPHRKLIGDDEHGWGEKGVFNFEGGCYAKTIDLSPETEPEIYGAIKRDALLENVVIKDGGEIDFHDDSKTANTRVSYPINHIENIVEPHSRGTHPHKVILLSCDAFGVLPPVAKLTKEQAMYLYLSGYTAKVAGTEMGVTEPKVAFSTCFGSPFLPLHPTKYAHILGDKMDEHGATAYLLNTGWSGGAYGVGERMSLKVTRKLVDDILENKLEEAECEAMPYFNFMIPKAIDGVDSNILNPRNTWDDKEAYDVAARDLAARFVENFKNYTDTPEGKAVESAGPKLD